MGCSSSNTVNTKSNLVEENNSSRSSLTENNNNIPQTIHVEKIETKNPKNNNNSKLSFTENNKIIPKPIQVQKKTQENKPSLNAYKNKIIPKPTQAENVQSTKIQENKILVNLFPITKTKNSNKKIFMKEIVKNFLYLTNDSAQKLFQRHKFMNSSNKLLAAGENILKMGKIDLNNLNNNEKSLKESSNTNYKSAVFNLKKGMMKTKIENLDDLENKEKLIEMFSSRFTGEKNINSFKTLDNEHIDRINYSAEKIKKYYKNQITPKEENFTDQIFPPNEDSLLGKRDNKYIDKIETRITKAKESFIIDIKEVIWLRAKEIFEGLDYNIFTNEIEFDDIVQGNLGNCYFLSTLAAMAELPQLIGQLFKTLTVPVNGCFEVAVRIQGKWKIVIIDDYFPCNKKTRKPIFAKPVEAELWVMILEKVWAKINGGYLNTIGGSAADVLNSFTSFPMSTIFHRNYSNLDTLWEIINSSGQIENSSSIMNCDSNKEIDIEKFGIISGHSFTITDLRDVIYNNTRIRLLQLRNPWGYKEWNGAWSDNSPLWKQENIIKILNVNLEQKDDGKFWISLEDFLKFFQSSHICRVTSPQCSRHISIHKENSNRPQIVELNINYTQNFVISAIKKIWRFTRILKSDEELTINLIIVKKNNLEFVASFHNNEYNPVIELLLTPGDYLVYSHANYENSTYPHKMKYILNFTSDKFFDVKHLGMDNDNFDLLKTIIINRIEDQYLKEDFLYSVNKFEMTTYSCLYIINKSQDDYEINCIDESNNFRILGKIKNKYFLNFNQKILILGIRKSYYEKFNFSIKVDSRKKIYEDSSSDSDNSENINKSKLKLESFFLSQLSKQKGEKSIQDYDFIYKKMDFDSSIVKKIDFIKLTENYFLNKYPEIQSIIEKAPKLNDEVEVIFRDIFDINEHCLYLGEWMVNRDLMRHGRGMSIWSDGSFYIGQFQNDISQGFGILQYPSGERIEITWIDGKMNGKGKYFRINNSSYDVEYENGKLSL